MGDRAGDGGDTLRCFVKVEEWVGGKGERWCCGDGDEWWSVVMSGGEW